MGKVDLTWIDQVPEDVEEALSPKVRQVLRALRELREERKTEG